MQNCIKAQKTTINAVINVDFFRIILYNKVAKKILNSIKRHYNMPKFNPRKLSFTTLNKFIEEGKKFLKTDPTMNDVFDKYQVSIKELDYIPIYFDLQLL